MSISLLIGIVFIVGIIAFSFVASIYKELGSIKRNKKKLENYDHLSKIKKERIEEKVPEFEERNLSDERHSVYMSNARNPVI